MLLITMMLTQAGLAENTAKVQGRYTPRNGSEPTFSSYMKSIRANQETGLIDPALMINSEEAIREGEMNWIVAGPDNFGALTRAMVFDRTDRLHRNNGRPYIQDNEQRHHLPAGFRDQPQHKLHGTG